MPEPDFICEGEIGMFGASPFDSIVIIAEVAVGTGELHEPIEQEADFHLFAGNQALNLAKSRFT